MSLVFRDYESFKEALDIYRQLTKSEVRPLREADLILALDVRRALVGLVNGRQNMLVSNFFSRLFRLLSNTNVNFVDYSGSTRALGAFQIAAVVIFGTIGSPGPSFTDYKLGNRDTTLEGSALTPSLTISSSEGRCRLGRVTAGTVYEAAIYQQWIDTGGTRVYVIDNRVVFSGGVPTGRTITHDIVFKPPFVQNITRVIFGWLTVTDAAGMKDIYGNAYSAWTSAERAPMLAPCNRMFVGRGTAGSDHTVQTLVDPLELDAAYSFTYTYGSYYRHIVTGVKKLTDGMTIGEVGLIQNLRDAAGATYPTMLARWPISPAVSKSAGDVVCAYAIIYASA